MVRFTNLQIRATYDQTLSDTYNVEALTPTTGVPVKVGHPLGEASVYIYARWGGRAEYSPGQARVDANAGFSYAGFPVVVYITEKMHVDSFAWLETTYQGQVSAHLRLNGTTYDDYNCQLRFEVSETSDLEFLAVRWLFTLMEAQ